MLHIAQSPGNLRLPLMGSWKAASIPQTWQRMQLLFNGRGRLLTVTAHAASALPPPDRPTTRLNKRMSELGLCSRREADAWISQGWVQVNGRVATIGSTVTAQDQVQVHADAREKQQKLVTVLLHKPVGYVSGQAEDNHIPAIVLIKQQARWAGDSSSQRFSPSHCLGLAPAGRLDLDSTGLLVFTQDGRVARKLIGEDSSVDKEYLVQVQFTPDGQLPYGAVQENVKSLFPASRLGLLRFGLSLDGVKLRPAKVEWHSPEQLRFVLRQGRKRQIRRMCQAVGLTVVALERVRIGKVKLGGLPAGQWRYLQPDEEF